VSATPHSGQKPAVKRSFVLRVLGDKQTHEDEHRKQREDKKYVERKVLHKTQQHPAILSKQAYKKILTRLYCYMAVFFLHFLRKQAVFHRTRDRGRNGLGRDVSRISA